MPLIKETGKPPERLELEELLEDNAYGGGLTREEFARASALIKKATSGEGECWACPAKNKRRAILDTGLCQEHASNALAVQLL